MCSDSPWEILGHCCGLRLLSLALREGGGGHQLESWDKGERKKAPQMRECYARWS